MKPQTYIRSIFKNIFFLTVLIFAANALAAGQALTSLDRGRAKDMLNTVKDTLKKEYYDPTFHGIDLDGRFKKAEEALDGATTLGQAFGIIAQAVLELNDSHTTFWPPQRTIIVSYGWRWQMFGEKCFVTSVKPKSDAEAQGLKPGDEIIEIEGFKPKRSEMWKVSYYYNVLSPRNGLNVKILSPGEQKPRELNIASKITQLQANMTMQDLWRQYQFQFDAEELNTFVTIGNTTVWKMRTFSIDPGTIAGIMNGRSGSNANLILDLRGNGGGYVVTLEELAGYFVDKDTKIADLKGRKKMDPQMAKTKGKDVYRGKLIVLIDSRSASASEIFARFIQLEQRGVVLGDQSAGAVMQSRGVGLNAGSWSDIPYGMNMTNADVIMTDGRSLEHYGVIPQLVMNPTGADLASHRDPVLAAALELFGEKMSPEDAGKLFPEKWEKKD
ncbi:MAG: PDZ domain-containing protein [Acidobacteria bacterium]|nr:PDZ domain-containing protein [Acidobacteriota bacterium]